MNLSFDKLQWSGRYLDHDGIRYFDYSASGFCFVMTGKKAQATFVTDAEKWVEENKAVLGVFITEGEDTSIKAIPEEPTFRVTLREAETHCTLFESEVEKTVTIRVMKFSEAAFGYAGLKSLKIDDEARWLSDVQHRIEITGGTGNLQSSAVVSIRPSDYSTTGLRLEFIGDSITCGYGIEGVWEKDTFTTAQERPDKAYAFQTAKALGAQVQLCSWSGIGITSGYVDPETVNLPDTNWLMQGVWPYTDKSLSLRLGIEPEVWDSKARYEPDFVIINLGTNDISWVREKEDRRLNYRAALKLLLEAVHRRSPGAKIIACLGSMGEALNETAAEAVNLFKKDFPGVTADFLPFTEQLPEDGIGTDWHPSAVTHKKMAEKLVQVIPNLFRDLSDRC